MFTRFGARLKAQKKCLPLRYVSPQRFMQSWGFPVTLNTMTCKHVFGPGYYILLFLEDFCIEVAPQLWRIFLKCRSKPFYDIDFLGARTRSSVFIWKHAFYFIWYILLKDWRRERLYPAIGCLQPKKWHMKDIINLICVWHLHALSYDPYTLDCLKWANPPW